MLDKLVLHTFGHIISQLSNPYVYVLIHQELYIIFLTFRCERTFMASVKQGNDVRMNQGAA